MDEKMPRGFRGEPSEVWEWDPLPRSWKVITTDAFINMETKKVSPKGTSWTEYWQKLDW